MMMPVCCCCCYHDAAAVVRRKEGSLPEICARYPCRSCWPARHRPSTKPGTLSSPFRCRAGIPAGTCRTIPPIFVLRSHGRWLLPASNRSPSRPTRAAPIRALPVAAGTVHRNNRKKIETVRCYHVIRTNKYRTQKQIISFIRWSSSFHTAYTI